MRLTFFPNVYANQALVHELTWEQIGQQCLQPQIYPTKQSLPLIKMAIFGNMRTSKGSLRHDKNVIAITGIEADYDAEVLGVQLANFKLMVAGIQAIVYTTPSHTPEKPRFRILAPLSREYPPEKRYEFVAILNGALEGTLAPESFTLSQSFYFGAVDGVVYEVAQSKGVCIDLLDDLPLVYPQGRETPTKVLNQPVQDITAEVIADLRSALSVLPADDYAEWIAIGQALVDLGEVGYQLWAEWSQKSSKYDPQDMGRWYTFTGDRTGYQAVFAKAQRLGWKNPRALSLPCFASGFQPNKIGSVRVSLDTKLNEFNFIHLTAKQKPKATIENLEYLLKAYGIACYYDELLKDGKIILPDGDHRVNDMTENGVYQTIKSLLALNEMPLAAADHIPAILMKHIRNPVKDYITANPWDGVSRLAAFYDSVKVAPEDMAYRNKAIRMWLVQCVAAADGAQLSPIPYKIEKFESVLVFQGQQGGKKTSWVRSLLPRELQAYILDGVTLDLSEKDSRKHAISGWIVELGELDGTFRRSDIAKLKGFLSHKTDDIRTPYDRKHSKFQRRTSYFASVNELRFLVDETGNRRFIPVRILSTDPLHGLDMQQVWAEVWCLYLGGEPWWPDAELESLLKSRHTDHQQIDHVEDALRSKFNLDAHPKTGKLYTCTELLTECGWKQPTRKDTNAVARILHEIGFDRPKIQGKKGYRLELLAIHEFGGISGG